MSKSKIQESVRIAVAGIAMTALATGGCASGGEAASPPPATPASAAAPATTFAAQVSAGQTLYGQHCATCHGDAGQGGKGPRVVGIAEGALPLDPPAERKVRKSRFVTVGDVAAFAVANMPPGKGGSLPADQYWDILAFDLHANGIDLPQPLTADVAKTLTIPR